MGKLFYLVVGYDGTMEVHAIDQQGNKNFYGNFPTVDEAVRAASGYAGKPLAIPLQDAPR